MSFRHMVLGPKPHIQSVALYWIVFFALVSLTLLTVYLSHYDFGAWSVLVTLIIAGTKALLVMGFFMHLFFDNKFYALVASTSLIFLSIFILSSVLDFDSRSYVDEQDANFRLRDEKVYQRSLNPENLPFRPGLSEPDKALLIDIGPGEH